MKIDDLVARTNALDSEIEQLRLTIDKIRSELATIGQEHRFAMEKQRSITESLNRFMLRKEPKV